MRYVREQGYPAPEIVSVNGADLVLERASGSTMRVDLARRPWTLIHHARLLADLQRRLHRIAAPEWLPAIGPGGAVIHLDLDPENAVVRAHLPAAIARRLSDPNMTARERELIPLVRM